MSTRLAEEALRLVDPDETVQRITRFVKTHIDRTGARCAVVGMSGGLDSSVVAALCSKAIGGRKTLAFSLQEYETGNPRSLKDATEVARKFRIPLRKLDISPLVDAAGVLVRPKKKVKSVPWGNVKARIRAMILYYFANSADGMVVGTGDKSEMMLGYFTKYGDGACDILPIADLYKTTVRQLAKYLEIPRGIYSKPSSPELWPGQTAEGELGLAYEKLDLILWGLERWMSPAEISQTLSIPIKSVEGVRSRWLHSEHKRRAPMVMKLGFRTPGQDLREPYTL